ncbi:Solute carrier family 12 member 8 [Armadillidium vulgare]|nr:Solute carrier family 12 member 8 [Armadillidium vulgare]
MYQKCRNVFWKCKYALEGVLHRKSHQSLLVNGRGPNKVPILSLVLTVIITTLFLLIGQINVLAPIVSAPFLIAYAAIDYAYFALAVTYQSDPSISKK